MFNMNVIRFGNNVIIRTETKRKFVQNQIKIFGGQTEINGKVRIMERTR